jgi:hypothetical protein
MLLGFSKSKTFCASILTPDVVFGWPRPGLLFNRRSGALCWFKIGRPELLSFVSTRGPVCPCRRASKRQTSAALCRTVRSSGRPLRRFSCVPHTRKEMGPLERKCALATEGKDPSDCFWGSPAYYERRATPRHTLPASEEGHAMRTDASARGGTNHSHPD